MPTNDALARGAGPELVSFASGIETGAVEAVRSISPAALVDIDREEAVARISDASISAIAGQLGVSESYVQDRGTVDLSTVDPQAPDAEQPIREQIDESEFIVPTGALDAENVALESERAFTSSVGGRYSYSQYESADRTDLDFVIEFPNQQEFVDFKDNIRALNVGAIDTPKFARSEGAAQANQDRQTRRELRNELDASLSDAGYDPNRWNTDARADGTLIIQDPDSKKTETIEPGEDADSFNPDTFDSSSSGTESPSSAPESNGTGATLPDMSGLNRPRVIAAILGVIALIYGATQ